MGTHMGAATRGQRQGSEPEAREALATGRANHGNRGQGRGQECVLKVRSDDWQQQAEDAQDAAVSAAHVSPLASHPRGRGPVVALLCRRSLIPVSWPRGRCPLTSCTVPQLSSTLTASSSLWSHPVSGFRPIHILMLFKLPTPVPTTSHPLSSRPEITSVLRLYRHHSWTSCTGLQPKPNLSPSELAIPYPVPLSKCQLHPSRCSEQQIFRERKKMIYKNTKDVHNLLLNTVVTKTL